MSLDHTVSSANITGKQLSIDDVKPMSRKDKMKQKLHGFFCCTKADSQPKRDPETGKQRKYFQITSDKSADNAPNSSLLIDYLNWSFETSFTRYLISALALYLLIIAFFAFLLILAVAHGASGATEKICYENLMIGDTFHEMYASAFTLSWTTFSTVGYGQIYPKVTAECGLSNFFTSIESFFGVLYAGFVGAIVFGKVQNVYSHAAVIFSDICVIRYGAGIMDIADDLDDSIEEDAGAPVESEPSPMKKEPSARSSGLKKTLPCPILLFRIANEKANSKFGNIVNLELDVVGVIEKRSDPTDGTRMRRQFRNLQIQPERVPLFDRIVFIRHVLNADSPLITMETRRMIKKNNGRWSATYDTYDKIRGAIHFAQINIALQGISNISKSTVYGQKTYDFDEVKIGFKFVDMTFENPESEKRFQVDLSLINLITEQEGGGSEPLILE